MWVELVAVIIQVSARFSEVMACKVSREELLREPNVNVTGRFYPPANRERCKEIIIKMHHMF